jgi:hypothetical protein
MDQDLCKNAITSREYKRREIRGQLGFEMERLVPKFDFSSVFRGQRQRCLANVLGPPASRDFPPAWANGAAVRYLFQSHHE